MTITHDKIASGCRSSRPAAGLAPMIFTPLRALPLPDGNAAAFEPEPAVADLELWQCRDQGELQYQRRQSQ